MEARIREPAVMTHLVKLTDLPATAAPKRQEIHGARGIFGAMSTGRGAHPRRGEAGRDGSGDYPPARPLPAIHSASRWATRSTPLADDTPIVSELPLPVRMGWRGALRGFMSRSS